MANLIYTTLASLDGYTSDADGRFDWAAPDEEVHAHVNDSERQIGTYLYGRRMYETMVFWETAHALSGEPAPIHDYARIWRAAEKVVFSRTLEAASSARTRIEREFDPETVHRLKAEAERDISIGGPDLAAQALDAGLVDEIRLYVVPFLAGGGHRSLPDGLQVGLELVDERRFAGGTVYVAYRPLVTA